MQGTPSRAASVSGDSSLISSAPMHKSRQLPGLIGLIAGPFPTDRSLMQQPGFTRGRLVCRVAWVTLLASVHSDTSVLFSQI